jgi:hypothetical protein
VRRQRVGTGKELIPVYLQGEKIHEDDRNIQDAIETFLAKEENKFVKQISAVNLEVLHCN